MKRTCLLLFLALTGVPYSLPCLAQVDGDGEIDMKALLDDVEVMRRVLVKVLESESDAITGAEAKKKGTGLRAPPGETVTFYSMTTLGVEKDFDAKSLYLPGIGVLFALQIPLPGHETSEAPEKKDEAEDLWAATEKEVQGKRLGLDLLRSTGKEKPREWSPDPDAVEELVTTLLRTLAQHSRHMDQLPPDEEVIVALRIRPGAIDSEDPEADEVTTLRNYRQFAGVLTDQYLVGRLSLHHLILRVLKRTLDQAGENGMDLEELRRKARITQYAGLPAGEGTTGIRWVR